MFPGSLFGLVVLVAVIGMVMRIVTGSFYRRSEGGGSVSSRLTRMEERIQKIEEATSGLIAEFAAVRERERFMTQLVESRARNDARIPAETAPSTSRPSDTTNPYVVQTVAAVRRKP